MLCLCHSHSVADLGKEGRIPLQLDSKKPKIKFAEYAYMEKCYTMLTKTHPEEAKRLLNQAQHDAEARCTFYEQLAAIQYSPAAPRG